MPLQLLRMMHPALRVAGQHTLAAASRAAALPLLTPADHDRLRQDCQTGVELVNAEREVPDSARIFTVRWLPKPPALRVAPRRTAACPLGSCVAAAAPGPHPTLPPWHPPPLLQPPPNSQLCRTMAFTYSFFFRGHAINPALLKRALQGLWASGGRRA